MKLDAHVHTYFSGHTSLYPLSLIMKESYNTPEGVYRRAKARGMDLVAITDHDTIDGALTIADRPDVIVGCEVTAIFPDDQVKVHLNVLDISEAQFAEIDRLRRDIGQLMPYLRHQRIFTSLNHVASRVNGQITAAHVARLMPWIDALEIRNGSRLAAQNMTATALAGACRKVGVAGSDSHTQRGVGRTYVVSDRATTREAFMQELRAGRIRVEGAHGHYFTMASDIVRLATGFYQEQIARFIEQPLQWRRHAMLLGAVVGLPLVTIPLALAYAHFVLEERFNQALLVDLVARPAGRLLEAA
ncbi:MAG: PHP domain-containing protein [Luteitalea sp.]|nr:PHP domain-containing protein [Luteitalea sp.]